MKTLRTHRFLALLGLFALSACDETGTEPPTFDDLTPDEALELAVLTDPGSLDIALELTTASNDVAASFGHARTSEGRDLNAQARVRFAAASDAMRAGDHRRALDEARAARRLIARAILATGGGEALVALLERIEALVAIISDEDSDVFDDPAALRAELEAISAAARELLARGDSLGAAERAILGEQRVRHRRGRLDRPGDVHPDRARLAVSLAATAVSLAERLVAENDMPVRDAVSDVLHRQNRWLAHANRMLEKAEQALAAGHFARAVHFAQLAHWSALKAVILPGGITEEELRAMAELANRLYEEARAALGDDPTDLELRLFQRAGRLIALGEEMLGEGNKRGVAALWRGAVISRWLMD